MRRYTMPPTGKYVIALIVGLFVIGIIHPSDYKNIKAISLREATELSLVIRYNCNGLSIKNAEFELYYVADVSSEGDILLQREFKDCTAILGFLAEEQWRLAADSLCRYAKANGLKPLDSGITDDQGVLQFPKQQTQLLEGLYLLIGHTVTKEKDSYSCEPILIHLPETEMGTGKRLNHVAVYPKAEKVFYEPSVSTTEAETETESDIEKTTESVKETILPQTGQLWWPLPIFVLSGGLCLAIGILQKHKKREYFCITGILLLMAGCILVLYNFREENKAMQAADTVLPLIEESMIPALHSSTGTPESVSGSLASRDSTENRDSVLRAEEIPTCTIDGQDYIGMLQIPTCNLTLPVIGEWNYPALKTAPCRYEGSVYQNNMIIAAHNYRSHFRNIKELDIGDSVSFTDMKGNLFLYEVAACEILKSTDLEEMTSGDWDLTLFTCTYGGRYRITVRCQRTG